ncbi:SLC13 family permease [Youngiibacter multivorans]|uniref:Anion transporter n=1 Tax=Youngiibacter multivorans TaxID=937251 RepID=A0ABS4G143_9CLOT|nr:DASS family sodium-coupled anion symporter [Youngiibacter multivorans]MBP1918265.1 anion transporter [Youngiibacter multivorans]
MEKTVKVTKVKGPFELKMQFFGLPLALLIFASIYSMPTPPGLSYAGKMALGVFLAALTLWISESIPNYAVSLLVIVALPLSGAWTEAQAMGVLGYEVIWLTFAAFIIASGMEKSGLARRMALFLISKFGKSVNSVLMLLIAINFLIAFVVPSTTARAAMMFPIVLLVVEAFEVNINDPKNNFGKMLALHGIQANNLSTAAIVTATSSQILAISFIKDLTGREVSWMEWFVASAPVTILTLVAMFFIGKVLFRLPKSEKTTLDLTKIKEEYVKLGKITINEKKALGIFLVTLSLWAMDSLQVKLFGFQLSLVMVAILSAALFFLPYVGILKWKEAKISWNLLIFACGAYAGGVALDETGLAAWGLNIIFKRMGVENMSFIVLFAVLMFIASFSHLLFTSKTVRTIILIPTIIGIANATGYDPVSLALPAAFCIADTITLPPHSKVNLIYYGTGYFTVLEQMLYGVLVLLAKWALMVLAAGTWFKFVGIV